MSVETTITRKIISVVEELRKKAHRGIPAVALVISDNGLGKSASLESISGMPYLIYIKADPNLLTPYALISEIARSGNIPRGHGFRATLGYILARAKREKQKTVLVIDEAKWVLRREKLAELLRLLMEQTKWNMVFLGNPDLLEHIQRVRGLGVRVDQILRVDGADYKEEDLIAIGRELGIKLRKDAIALLLSELREGTPMTQIVYALCEFGEGEEVGKEEVQEVLEIKNFVSGGSVS